MDTSKVWWSTSAGGTHSVVSITQQLVNDVTELPRGYRVFLDGKSTSHTPEQKCTLVMM